MTRPFDDHRERLLTALAGSQAAGIYFSGGEKIRNGDSTFRFRPESDFYYLTGCREPEACLVLVPSGEQRSVLFLRPKDPEAEIWTGRRVGVEAAPETFGVDLAYGIDELPTRLPKLLAGHRGIEYAVGGDPERDALVTRAAERAVRLSRAKGVAPEVWFHPRVHVHEARLFKGPEEIAIMRGAAEITAEAHRAVMAAAEPGKSEAELDALLEFTFRRRGGTGSAYSNIVAGGANACILHYVDNDQPLIAGELCLVDAGAELSYYASDVTRTFPVDGRFTEAQRQLYEVVLAAQEAAIEHAQPGVTFESVHEVALERLIEGMLATGLLQGSVAEARESGSYRRFYMHRTSHWLGLDVHDAGAYVVDGSSRRLEPGMVLTIEPGLYVAPDADADTRWRGIGIRIEDDVLITAGGRDVLTRDVPKSVGEVEAACEEAAALA